MDLTPEQIFEFANAAVLPVWLLMMFAPRWRGTKWVVETRAGVILLAALYAFLVIPTLPQALPIVSNPKLPVLLNALGNPLGFTILWVHLVVFDLFVGTWVFEQCQRRRDPAWIRVALLVVCLMFGPIGFLAERARHYAQNR